MGLNLLEKTELWINEITLDHTNLTDLANAVARSLGLSDGEVLVVDVRSPPATSRWMCWRRIFPRKTSSAGKPQFWTQWGLCPA